jgi:hypothetical protein
VLVLEQYRRFAGMTISEKLAAPAFRSNVHASGYLAAKLSPGRPEPLPRARPHTTRAASERGGSGPWYFAAWGPNTCLLPRTSLVNRLTAEATPVVIRAPS